MNSLLIILFIMIRRSLRPNRGAENRRETTDTASGMNMILLMTSGRTIGTNTPTRKKPGTPGATADVPFQRTHRKRSEPPQQIVLLRRLFITSELFISKSKRCIKSTSAPIGSTVHVIYRPAISQSDGLASLALHKERSVPAEELIGKQHGEQPRYADQHAAEPAEPRSLMGQRWAVRQIEDR